MTLTTNGRVLFNSIPEGFPVPGKSVVYDESQTIDLNNVILSGGVLIKILELSIDPYMRGRMVAPSDHSYIPPYDLGKPLQGHGVGVVIRSENANFSVGEHVSGIFEHANYVIRKFEEDGIYGPIIVINNTYKLPLSAFIGVLGMPGKTAYYGWKEYAAAKKGETVFVTTGAGPVGSLVIQLAKIDGLKVIASAGSEEKVQFMKEIGADVAFNYKTTDTREILKKEGPIDVFWDNVGGETLEAAFEYANFHGRFIECGMISGYNTGNAKPVSNLFKIIERSLRICGFIVPNLEEKWSVSFWKDIAPLVGSGSIKYKEDVSNGLQTAGDVILAVQQGTNKGKAVIHVATE